MTNMNDDNNPSRGELGVTGASAATAVASRRARGSSSVTSEEDSLDLRNFCRSPLLTEDSLRKRFSSLDNGNGAVDFPHDMNIILFDVCANEHVTLGIVQCVLEYFPGSVEAVTSTGTTPLHVLCRNKNVTLEIVEFLVKEYPDALSLQDENGMSPLFYLCRNNELNDSAAVEILDLLLERCPELAKQSCTVGCLPIWYAIRWQSPDFCCKLMAVFPEGIHHEANENGSMLLDVLDSPRVDDTVAQAVLEMLVGNHQDLIRRFCWKGNSPLHKVAMAKISRSAELCGLLLRALPELVDTFTLPDEGHDIAFMKPLHYACLRGNLPVVKCIVNMFPNAIFGQTSRGHFPIHFAVAALYFESTLVTPEDNMEVIRFLLAVDASVASQTYSIGGNVYTPLRLACFYTNASNSSVGLPVIKLLHDTHPEAIYTLDGLLVIAEVAAFLNPQLQYALIALDPELVTTPDEDGNLPIHRALYDDRVALGTIKLLLDANNSTLLTPTHNGNTLLHEACRLGEYGVIEMLMTRYPTEQVHTQNSLGELPIQVLIESDTNEPESAEHLSSIFLLLRASPAVLMNGTELGSE